MHCWIYLRKIRCAWMDGNLAAKHVLYCRPVWLCQCSIMIHAFCACYSYSSFWNPTYDMPISFPFPFFRFFSGKIKLSGQVAFEEDNQERYQSRNEIARNMDTWTLISIEVLVDATLVLLLKNRKIIRKRAV